MLYVKHSDAMNSIVSRRNGDSIGIWPRIIRLNAFPLFVFTLFVAGSILVHSFGGKLSSKLFQSESALEQVLSFVSDFTVSVRARKWTSPFTSGTSAGLLYSSPLLSCCVLSQSSVAFST